MNYWKENISFILSQRRHFYYFYKDNSSEKIKTLSTKNTKTRTALYTLNTAVKSWTRSSNITKKNIQETRSSLYTRRGKQNFTMNTIDNDLDGGAWELYINIMPFPICQFDIVDVQMLIIVREIESSVNHLSLW